MKQCNKCKEFKELTEFYKDKSRKDGLQCYCNSCKRICQKENPQDPIKCRSDYLKKTYKISLIDYDNILISQNNVCAICGETPDIKRNLDIDHCHETGKVRGILCHHCNKALGHFKDDSDIILKAYNYLIKNK